MYNRKCQKGSCTQRWDGAEDSVFCLSNSTCAGYELGEFSDLLRLRDKDRDGSGRGSTKSLHLLQTACTCTIWGRISVLVISSDTSVPCSDMISNRSNIKWNSAR